MIYFPSQPIIEGRKDGLWELKCDYRVVIGKRQITIKEGFVFDGASIPRICWRLVGHPMQLPMLAAAIIHDALYASELTTREIADEIFRALMRRLKIGLVKRNTVYYAVRTFGGVVWKNHTVSSVIDVRKMVEVTTCETAPNLQQ